MAAKHNPMKILSAFEVGGKMEMGLCLLCDESFTLDHAMKHKGVRFIVVDLDEEVHDIAEESQGSSESTPFFTDLLMFCYRNQNSL